MRETSVKISRFIMAALCGLIATYVCLIPGSVCIVMVKQEPHTVQHIVGLLVITGAVLVGFMCGRRYYRGSPPRPASPQCAACGYDLTGNVSGICPECGTPTPSPERPVAEKRGEH